MLMWCSLFRKLIFCLNSWTIAWYLLIVCHVVTVIKQTNQIRNKWNFAVCSLIILFMLRLALFLRPYNILLPSILVYTCKLIRLKNWNTLTTTILHYWLSLLFFFYQVVIFSLAILLTIIVLCGYDQIQFNILYIYDGNDYLLWKILVN